MVTFLNISDHTMLIVRTMTIEINNIVIKLLQLLSCLCYSVTRRIRELNENNTKKFIEERKRQAMLQSRRLESLVKLHQEHIEKLNRDMQRVMYRTCIINYTCLV